MREREEFAIVLDFLPHGYPFDSRPAHRKTPIAQAMGQNHFVLLEVVPKKGGTGTTYIFYSWCAMDYSRSNYFGAFSTLQGKENCAII